jgi:hypothetical protein
MSYVALITLPVVFHADDDNEARAVLELLRAHLAGVSVRSFVPEAFAPEVSDYPDASLQEVLPYEEPRAVGLTL